MHMVRLPTAPTTQALRALKVANERRCSAASVRRRVAGCDRVTAMMLVARLLDGSSAVGSLRLEALLRAIRQMGPVTVARLVDNASLPRSILLARVEDLTATHRSMLAAELRAYAKRNGHAPRQDR